MNIASKGRSLHALLITLVVILTVAGLATAAYFISDTSGTVEAPEKTTYDILIPEYIEVYSDRLQILSPDVVSSDREYISGKFKYELVDANASKDISINKNGEITVLTPGFNGEVEVRIIDQNTGAEKIVKLRIVAELSGVLEIRDGNGNALSSDESLSMEIGESYTFEVITLPSVAEVEDYITVVGANGDGDAEGVFDVKIEANRVTLTAIGAGSGNATFAIKNEGRGVNYRVSVPFSIGFPDEALTAAVLGNTDDGLLSAEEIASIERIVFDEDVLDVSMEKADLLSGLRVMVFKADGIVSVDLAYVDDDMIFRVAGEELYLEYVEDVAWSGVRNNIYPYVDDYTKPVVVLHNEDRYVLDGTGVSSDGIRTEDGNVYDYVSATSPKIQTLVIEDGVSVPTYAYEGFIFGGWKDLSGFSFETEDIPSVYEGIHVNATWSAESYRITLDGHYTNGYVNNIVLATYHSTLSELPPASKAGWTFDGWYTDTDYVNEVTDGMIYMMTDDVTLYAKFIADITLDYSGIISENVVVEDFIYGKTLGENLSLSDEDYAKFDSVWTFDPDGWNDSSHHTGSLFSPDSAYVREGENIAHTLYARFTRSVSLNTLEISDTEIDSITLIGGLTLNESLNAFGREPLANQKPTVNAEYSSWNFYGWTNVDLGDGSLKINLLPGDVVSGDTVLSTDVDALYAIYYGSVTYKYGPHYNNNLSFTRRVVYGTLFSFPEVSASYDDEDTVNSYVGYEFAGWALLNDEWKVEKDQIPTDLTVGADTVYKTYVAKYNVLPYTITFYDENKNLLTSDPYTGLVFYDVGYNANDNVWNNDDESFTGREVQIPATPDVTGHTGNWLWAVNGTKQGSINAGAVNWRVPASVLSDVILHANYNANSYRISYDTHDSDSDLESVSNYVIYGTIFGYLPAKSEIKTPSGYYFDGWYLDADYKTRVTEETLYAPDDPSDITLYAKFCINVTFDYGLRDQSDTKVFIYKATNEFNVLSNEGAWSFVGWYDENGNVIIPDQNGKIFIDNYVSSNTYYKACWTRDLTVSVNSGFAVSDDGKIKVYHGSGASVTVEVSDLDGWEIDSWYYVSSLGEKIKLDSITIPVGVVNDTSITHIYADFKSRVTVVFDIDKDDLDPIVGEVDIILGETVFDRIVAAYKGQIPGFVGYKHVGWKIGNNEYSSSSNLSAVKGLANATIYAKYVPVPYTVNFDSNGGSPADKIDAKYDETYGVPTVIRPGYTFDGWYSDKEFKSDEIKSIYNLVSIYDGKITLYAKWTNNEYTVIFDADNGSENTSVNAVYDDVLFTFPEPDPEKLGHKFLGWYYNGIKVEVGNIATEKDAKITLIAEWDPIKYNVVFDSCGGTEVGDIENNLFGKDGYVSEETTRNWYEFAGWYLNSDYTGDAYYYGDTFNSLSATDGDTVTLYAKWIPKVYTITYNYPDDEPYTIEFDITDKSYYQPELRKEAGYIVSWDMSGLPYGDESKEPKNYVVEPKKNEIVYSIRFYVDGEVIKTFNYTVTSLDLLEEAGIIPTAPNKLGYDSIGWDKGESDILALRDTLGNLDVYAIYEAKTYTIVFLDPFVDYPEKVEFTLDDVTIPIPPAIEVDGGYYEWNVSREYLIAEIEKIENGEISIISVDGAFIYKVYTITVNNGTADFEYIRSGNSGRTVKIVAPEIEDGYEFVAFNGAKISSYEDGIITLTLIGNEDVYIGVREIGRDSYTVVFDYLVGKEYSSVAVGEGITLPDVSRDGYILSGWSYQNQPVYDGDVLDVEKDSVVTLVAQWTPIRYTVVLDANGGNVENTEFEALYGESIALDTPVRAGYTFLGWRFGTELISVATNLTTVDESVVTLVAEWTPVIYNVVFDSDGGSMTPSNTAVKYDELITLPYGITKTGYILLGWECNGVEYKGSYASNLSTLNRDTVTLKAIWKPITYTVIFADSDLEPAVLEYDGDYTFSEVTREGYKFRYWRCTIDGITQTFTTGYRIPNLTTVDGDIVTVTAIWAKDNSQIKFNYNAEYGALISKNKYDNTGFVDEYKPDELESVNIDDGYVAGWTPYSVIDGTYYYSTDLMTGKISDGWVAVEYKYDGKTAYRILNTNTGSELDFTGVEPTIPYKEGYKAEWKYTQDATSSYIYVAEAVYTPENEETYTVIFNTGCSVTLEPVTLAFGESIVLESITRDGCIFLGWRCADVLYLAGEESILNSEGKYAVIVLTAEWDFISYNIDFAGISKGSYNVETRPGDIKLPDEVPSRVGYVGKWVIPNLTYGDIELHPVYTPITYTVAFNLNGADTEFADISVYYDSQVLLGAPTKEGSVFLHWEYNGIKYSGEEAVRMTMTDVDGETVTLNAVWEDKTYTATFIMGDKEFEIEFSDEDIARGYIIPPMLEQRAYYKAYWEHYTLTPNDITVRAIYVPNVYVIWYYVDGYEVYRSSYTAETEPTFAPNIPERIGYNAAWSEMAAGIGSKNVYAIYTPINYTIDFDSNGGNNVDSYIATYDSIVDLPIPERDGYTFMGWEYGEEIFLTTNNISSVDGSHVILVAKWQATEYKIVFLDEDGNTLVSAGAINYTVETPIEEIIAQYPDIAEYITARPGYDMHWEEITKLSAGGMAVKPVLTEIKYYVIFDGYQDIVEWTVSSGAISEPDPAQDHVWMIKIDDKTYVDYLLEVDSFTFNEQTGRYELKLSQVDINKVDKINDYKVTFVDNDQLIATRYFDIAPGAVITLPGVPSKLGYVNGRWDTSDMNSWVDATVSDDGLVITINSLPDGFEEYYPPEGIEIKAVYTPLSFTVVYDVNSGDVNPELTDQNATYISKTQISNVIPTRTGYKFLGWTYDGHDNDSLIAAGSPVYLRCTEHEGTLTLLAVWEPIKYLVEIIENGYAKEPIEVTYEEYFTFPESTVIRDHYTFVSWKIGDEVYAPGDSIKNLTAFEGYTVEIVAEYKPVEYKISYVADGIIVHEDSYTVTDNKLSEIPSIPDKVHYSGEWKINLGDEWISFSDYVLTSGDISVEAVYTPNKYTVEYHIAEDNVVVVEYYYGDTLITSPEIPEVEGKIGSWPEIILDGGNKVVYPIYTPIVYTVYFYDKADGEEGAAIISSATYTVDSKDIAVPPVPYGYAAWNVPGLTTGDVHVYPTGKIEGSHLITFVDELNNVVATVIVNSGTASTEVTKPVVPAKVGYTAKWSDMPEIIDKDITVRATYKIDIYTVTFYNDRDEVYYTTTYTVENTVISLPKVPIKSENSQHYDDGRWDIGKLTHGDVDVYPSYMPKVYIITFTAMKNSGERIIVARHEYTIENPTVSLPPIPEREGYDHTLAFWGDTEGKLTSLDTQLCDFEIEAVYDGYYINFDLEGVVDYTDTPLAVKPVIASGLNGFTLPKPTLRKGYTFIEWSYNGKSFKANQKYYDDFSADAKDGGIQFTAVWEANSFVVAFDANGGEFWIDKILVEFDGKYNIEDANEPNLFVPTRSGYTFVGWYYGDEKITGSTIVSATSNHTLTARWLINNYTIILSQGIGTTLTITYDGKTYTASDKASHTLPYDTKYTINASLNTGYNTLMCSTGEKTLKDNCTHTSSAKPNTYNVKYHANNATGGSMANSNHSYDTSKKLSTNAFYRTGYTFIGWNTNADGSGTSYSNTETVKNLTSTNGGTVTLYAQWSVNKYTISVSTNNATVKVNGSDVANGSSVDVYYGSYVEFSVSYTESDSQSCSAVGTDGTTYTSPFYMPAQNVKISASSSAPPSSGGGGICFIEGTLITLSDGTVKPVEELVSGDKLLVFNHNTGMIEISECVNNVFVEKDAAIYNVINLSFSNGTIIRIGDKHGFYNATLNKYVYITEENATDFIGHEFYSVSQINGEYVGERIVLTDVEITSEFVRACSPITNGTLNCFAEGVLSVTAFPYDIEGFVNIFEYDENMKYDEERKQSDIEKYGLYTQDDFGGVIPAELFEAFNAQYLKVSVGKGYITEEEIMILLQFWINQGYI